MKPRFVVRIEVGGRMRSFFSDRSTGGEAIAEICEALGISFPCFASAKRVAA